MLKGDADQVELVQRRSALKPGQQHTVIAHEVHCVGPREEYALAGGVRTAVDHLVQDAQAGMRHADFVAVRVTQGDSNCDFMRLDDRVELAPDIPGRGLHLVEQMFRQHRQSNAAPADRWSLKPSCDRDRSQVNDTVLRRGVSRKRIHTWDEMGRSA